MIPGLLHRYGRRRLALLCRDMCLLPKHGTACTYRYRRQSIHLRSFLMSGPPGALFCCPGGVAGASDLEVLPVRRGRRAGPEPGGERMAMVGIDELRERLGVSLVADVPARRPHQLARTLFRPGLR